MGGHVCESEVWRDMRKSPKNESLYPHKRDLSKNFGLALANSLRSSVIYLVNPCIFEVMTLEAEDTISGDIM